MTTIPSWLFQSFTHSDPFHRGPFHGPAGHKHWHNQITNSIREHVVEKLVKASGAGEYMDQAKKMEQKMYDEGHSRAEYYRMVVKKVKQLLKEKRAMEKKKPMRYY